MGKGSGARPGLLLGVPPSRYQPGFKSGLGSRPPGDHAQTSVPPHLHLDEMHQPRGAWRRRALPCVLGHRPRPAALEVPSIHCAASPAHLYPALGQKPVGTPGKLCGPGGPPPTLPPSQGLEAPWPHDEGLGLGVGVVGPASGAHPATKRDRRGPGGVNVDTQRSKDPWGRDGREGSGPASAPPPPREHSLCS